MRYVHKAQAQAMVEFALAATLLFFLLAAAVDLGFLFFTKQGLTTAAQEGTTFGSRWLTDGGGGTRALDVAEIQKRVRYESGTNGGNGISNLTDLNSNGIDDLKESGIIDPTGNTGYIQVRALADNNSNGDPTDDGGAICSDPATSTVSCYVDVRVQKIHKMFFPLSPAFGNEVTVVSEAYLLVRDSYRTGSAATPQFATPTAKADPSTLVVSITASDFSARTGTKWEVTAYDTAVGTSNGSGIDHVLMKVIFHDGYSTSQDSYGKPYCTFGGSCAQMDTTTWNNHVKADPSCYGQNFGITATAYSTSGVSKTVTATVKCMYK